MQSSALKQKAWQDAVQSCTPSTPILPPGEAVMSADSHIARPAHTWLHTGRHLFLPSLSLHHEYGYFPHKWGGFVFCTHPRAGLAMTCLQRGSARFFTRWFLCCFIYLPARILFLPSAVMTITNHRVETFPPSLRFQSYIISNNLIYGCEGLGNVRYVDNAHWARMGYDVCWEMKSLSVRRPINHLGVFYIQHHTTSGLKHFFFHSLNDTSYVTLSVLKCEYFTISKPRIFFKKSYIPPHNCQIQWRSPINQWRTENSYLTPPLLPVVCTVCNNKSSVKIQPLIIAH